MPDYAAGKVYVIRNRAAGDGVVYVGSTTQTLCERMNGHRRDMKRHPDWKMYKMMAEVGVEHFHIELLADFPCERREQLLAEEGRHIRALRPECNERIAGRTREEYQRDNPGVAAAHKKAWREANPGVNAARKKAWFESNPGVTAARMKAYREANPGVDAARCKTYREANPGVIAARCKAYRDANPGANAARCKAYHERKKAESIAAAVDAATAGVAAAAIV